MEAMTLDAARAALAQTYQSGGTWLENLYVAAAVQLPLGALAVMVVFVGLVMTLNAPRLPIKCLTAALTAAIVTSLGVIEWHVNFQPLPAEVERAGRAVFAAQAYLDDDEPMPADQQLSVRKLLHARLSLELDIERGERKLQRLCESGIPGVSGEACPHGQHTLHTVKQMLNLGW